MTHFSTSVGTFVKTGILSPLVDWLAKTHNLTVTVEDLAQVLELPATPKPAYAIGMAPPTFTTVNTTVGAKAPGRSRKTTTSNPNGPKCTYQFTRGVRSGTVCTEPAADNGLYCKHCMKNEGPKKDIASRLNKNPGSVEPSSAGTVPTKRVLNAVAIVGQLGYFKEISRNLLLKKTGPESYVAVGVLNADPNAFPRKLTEEEKGFARDELELQVDDSSAVASVPTYVPSSVSVPGLPAGFTMPSLANFAPAV